MAQMNMQEAKTNLSKLVALAEQGEDVYIASRGKKRVQLVVVDEESEPRRPKLGGVAMKISDDFDDPMTEDELSLWE